MLEILCNTISHFQFTENMNQKSKKGFEISLAVNLSDKQRILYILPPNRRASIIAQYLKENPESEFILKW
jgi:hypothetical protein